MRISTDPPGDKGNPFAELFRMQAEFQARLAEETLRYLRRLQGALAPSTPGTVLLADPDAELRGAGSPGASVALSLEIENRQRVHCVVTPLITPLVDASGVTWFPEATPSPPALLLAPDDVRSVEVEVTVPEDLPAGTYRGALMLQGCRQDGVPVVITVSESRRRPPGGRSRPARPRSGGRRGGSQGREAT